jgi:TPR repeat protein
VQQDADSAQYWYERAAEKGHATAQLNLGILLLQQADTVAATLWLQQAAEQGNEGAQRILRMLHEKQE